MKQYTVYDVVTGKILRVLLQAKPPIVGDGQAFIEGNYPDDQFNIVDGEPVSNPKDTRRSAPLKEVKKKDELTEEGKVRLARDITLQQSDWTQVADAPVDQVAWATYRQALRDIPEQDSFPDNVIWPTPPT